MSGKLLIKIAFLHSSKSWKEKFYEIEIGSISEGFKFNHFLLVYVSLSSFYSFGRSTTE